jgi:Aminoglycoside-2''-adenylyltransferase
VPEALGEWEPLSVDAVTGLLRGMDARWWIAGGWALDLHLGRQTRPHHDIDVLVLREDLPGVRERLRGCAAGTCTPPTLPARAA